MIADKTLGLRLRERIKLGKDTYTIVGITSGMVSIAAATALVSLPSGTRRRFSSTCRARPSVWSGRRRPERAASADDIFRSQPLLEQATRSPHGATPGRGSARNSAPWSCGSLPARTCRAWQTTISELGGRLRLYPGRTRGSPVEGHGGQGPQADWGVPGLLTIISAIIMALILYTLTLDKLHSIALLKLIGAPNRVILGLILQQAIVLGAARLRDRVSGRAEALSVLSPAGHPHRRRPASTGRHRAGDFRALQFPGDLAGDAGRAQRGADGMTCP